MRSHAANTIPSTFVKESIKSPPQPCKRKDDDSLRLILVKLSLGRQNPGISSLRPGIVAMRNGLPTMACLYMSAVTGGEVASPLDRFSKLDGSTTKLVTTLKIWWFWKHLMEGFPSTYRATHLIVQQSSFESRPREVTISSGTPPATLTLGQGNHNTPTHTYLCEPSGAMIPRAVSGVAHKHQQLRGLVRVQGRSKPAAVAARHASSRGKPLPLKVE